MVQTVKIGISRPSETITTITPPAATTTTATTTTTTISNVTATEVTDDYTETTFLLDTTENVPSTTTPPPNNTTIRYFQVPTLPPKTTKPKVVKIRTTKPTTRTPTTTVTPDEYDTDNLDDDDGNSGENTKKIKSVNKGYADAGDIGPSNYYCSCNLLANDCDINCCCDTDCSAEALKVFDCYAIRKHPELRNRLEDFHYQHGLPSCRINDGWLCIIRSNVKTEPQKVC